MTEWNYARAKARVLRQFYRDYLTRLLAYTGGNITHAAELANKDRRDLGRLVQRYLMSDLKCIECHTGERIHQRRVCADCERERKRLVQAAARRGRSAKPRNPQSCNCGNPACNGLQCESKRHGTVA